MDGATGEWHLFSLKAVSTDIWELIIARGDSRLRTLIDASGEIPKAGKWSVADALRVFRDVEADGTRLPTLDENPKYGLDYLGDTPESAMIHTAYENRQAYAWLARFASAVSAGLHAPPSEMVSVTVDIFRGMDSGSSLYWTDGWVSYNWYRGAGDGPEPFRTGSTCVEKGTLLLLMLLKDTLRPTAEGLHDRELKDLAQAYGIDAEEDETD